MKHSYVSVAITQLPRYKINDTTSFINPTTDFKFKEFTMQFYTKGPLRHSYNLIRFLSQRYRIKVRSDTNVIRISSYQIRIKQKNCFQYTNLIRFSMLTKFASWIRIQFVSAMYNSYQFISITSSIFFIPLRAK